MKAFFGALPPLIKATLGPGSDQTVGSLAGLFCSSEPTSFQPPLCSPPKKKKKPFLSPPSFPGEVDDDV